MTTATEIPHGTLTGRKYHKCGCARCREAANSYARNRTRKQAYGTWQPLIDAEETRAHVRRIMAAGIGWQRIADHAGVSRGVVQRLLYNFANHPASKRIRPDHAAALLAVNPSPTLLPEGSLIDATGSRRRLQALVVAGWSQRSLAPRLGMTERHISHLMRRRYMQLRTADSITALYSELRDADPLEHGVTPLGYRRAVLKGNANGWLPAAAWDTDIDDPDTTPYDQETPGAREAKTALAAARAEDIEFLAKRGVCEDDIAARVGLTVKYVHSQLDGTRGPGWRERVDA